MALNDTAWLTCGGRTWLGVFADSWAAAYAVKTDSRLV